MIFGHGVVRRGEGRISHESDVSPEVAAAVVGWD
jgi:hypothetical protein